MRKTALSLALSLAAVSLPALAEGTVKLTGTDTQGAVCHVQLDFSAAGELSQVRFDGTIVDTLKLPDIVGGRWGTLYDPAVFNSEVNFVAGFSVESAGLLGVAVKGVGYRLPYDGDKYTQGYTPDVKQIIWLYPSLEAPTSLTYHAEQFPILGIPDETVDLGCEQLQ